MPSEHFGWAAAFLFVAALSSGLWPTESLAEADAKRIFIVQSQEKGQAWQKG
jgi:hypothetical protein